MAFLKGLRLDGVDALSFEQLFAPVLPDFAALYWHVDAQSGPFDVLARPDSDSVEAELEALSVDTGLRTSATLWRPGVFPRFAGMLVVDEWTYLVGLDGPEAKALGVSRALAQVGVLCQEGFTVVDREARVFVMHVASGWWEMYPAGSPMLSALARRGDVVEIDASVWWQTPDGGRRTSG